MDWDERIDGEGGGLGYLPVKRMLDAGASALLLAAFSPILLACALAIRLDSEGPVFFRQSRLGRNGRVFRIFKFRTMVPNATASGDGLLTRSNDPRITRVGAVLRRFRLDELPQLINVLLGDMSLVGPRPLLPEFLPYYTETDRKRLLVPPGMTGWQQVTGGSRDSWDERIQHDLWYVRNLGPWTDLMILVQTPLVVLRGNSVYGADGWQRSGVPTQCHITDFTVPNIPSQEEQAK